MTKGTTVESSFILELLSIRKVEDIKLVISRFENYIEKEGYGIIDDSNEYLEIENSNKKMWLNFFVNSMKYWNQQLMKGNVEEEKEDEINQLLDSLSKIITLFSGRNASGERISKFLLNQVQIQLKEPSFDNADLGWKTWPAGSLLARVKFNSKVLELGSGTGLVGISSAITNSNERHYLSDYHPNVLSNLNCNIQLNKLSNTSSLLLDWNWFEDTNDGDSIKNITATKDIINNDSDTFKFDFILASDVLYQLRHAYSFPKVIHYFLNNNDNSEAIDDGDNNTINNTKDDDTITNINNKLKRHLTSSKNKAIILIPIRKTHLKDSNEFEKQIVNHSLKIEFEVAYPSVDNNNNSININNYNTITSLLDHPLPYSDLTTIIEKSILDHPILAYKLYIITK
ncbi:hypothetical protein K502DRAFT_326931 [Neoconidiobolus thromboides FSU 785]|nr:hypothetical protein K502DRAFT_326931 [Neoconidiobolus thromboides FSU 785]